MIATRNRLALLFALAVFCVATLLVSTAAAQKANSRAADEAAIRQLDTQWSKTAAALDVDGTVAYYADDASVLAPNAPIASDKKTIRDLWAALLAPGTTISWKVDKVEVAGSRDLAYSMGTYELSMKDAQGKVTNDRGKLVEVWKKQKDGKWKVVADIFNSDLPVTPSPQ